MSQVAKMQAAALAEDPSIFDYDSHFDAIREQREGPKAADRQERKSRYIEGLLDKAKERQKEQDIVYERRQECFINFSPTYWPLSSAANLLCCTRVVRMKTGPSSPI